MPYERIGRKNSQKDGNVCITNEPMYHHCVYCYDYNSETDEAIFVIWNTTGRPTRWGNQTARQLLERRMPEMSFSEEELIEHPDEWDWAVVRMNKDYKLDKLMCVRRELE